jgi:hypothetical protein
MQKVEHKITKTKIFNKFILSNVDFTFEQIICIKTLKIV